jgi:glutamyl-tRNA synthetase
MDKLKWVNSQYIKQKSPQELLELLLPFLKEKGYVGNDYDQEKLEAILKLYQGRADTLLDFIDWTEYIFVDKISISAEDREKHLTPDKRQQFELLKKHLDALKNFDAILAEKTFRATVEELGIKAGDLVHPVRVALTGKTVGPGLFETMAVLGKEKTVQRLSQTFSS